MRAAQASTGWWHWIDASDQATLCGRPLIGMKIGRTLDFEHAPPGQVCVPCEAARLSGEGEHARRIVLKPSFGVLRKTGPLIHGTRHKQHGQELPRHDL